MDGGEATGNRNRQSKGKGCGDWRQEVAWGLGACWSDAGGLVDLIGPAGRQC